MAKEKAAPAGAPAWMVTFADLMSLLVCFFVLIISFSVQDEQKLQVVAGSVRDAFGVSRDWQARALVEIDGRPNVRKIKQPPSQNVVVYMPRPDRPPPEDAKEDDSAVDPQPQSGEPSPNEAAEELLASAADFLEVSDYAGESIHAHVGDPGAEGGDAGPGAYGHAQDWREQFRQEKLAQKEDQLIATLRSKLEDLSIAQPELAKLADNLTAERVEEGVRIELIDDLNQPMFRLGSAELDATVMPLLKEVASLVASSDSRLLITGHTDGRPYRGRKDYDNWALSSDRAHATRRALLAAGVPPQKISAVVGKGDSDHALPESPDDPRNRRIGILLLRDGA